MEDAPVSHRRLMFSIAVASSLLGGRGSSESWPCTLPDDDDVGSALPLGLRLLLLLSLLLLTVWLA